MSRPGRSQADDRRPRGPRRGPGGEAPERTRRDAGDDAAGDPRTEGLRVRSGGATSLSTPELLPPRMRRRRAFTLLWLTLFAPGSAQLVGGNRRLGRVALRVWLGVLAAAVLVGVLALVSRSMLLGLARPPVFLVLSVLLAAGAIGWALLFVDAFRLGRPGLLAAPTRRWAAALTAVLVVLTSGTLGLAAVNVRAAGSAITASFGGHTSVPPSEGRYNILLMGGDSGRDRTGTRPDTIMLASVDADTGKAVMFGFARDTENIRFRPGSTMAQLMPEGWNCGDSCLLNGLYQWATEHRDRFPDDVADPGALATKEAVESLSGLDIQYYALVDLKGFQRLVDAVGGLDIDVKKRVPIGGGTSPVKGWIEPGEQHLDGYHSLWYARSREGSSNYERMSRQRCVMTAMLHQLTPQTVIFKFKDIAAVSGSMLRTDIPDSDLGRLGDLAIKARGQKIRSVNFVPPTIKPWDYDPQVIRDLVRTTVAESAQDSTPPRKRAATRGTSTGDGSGAQSPEGTRTPPRGGVTEDLTSVCSAG